MKISLNFLQPSFAPWIGFFEQLNLVDIYCVMIDVQVSRKVNLHRTKLFDFKNSKYFWFNIKTKKYSSRETISNIEIINLNENKEKLIEYFYQNKIYFPYYLDVERIINNSFDEKFMFIYELNLKLIKEICKYLGLKKKFKIIDKRFQFEKNKNTLHYKNDYLISVIKYFNASEYVTGHGAKNYLDKSIFQKNNIDVRLMDYKNINYFNKEDKFIAFLSILDLIGRKGRNSKNYLISQTNSF